MKLTTILLQVQCEDQSTNFCSSNSGLVRVAMLLLELQEVNNWSVEQQRFHTKDGLWIHKVWFVVHESCQSMFIFCG